MGRPTQANVDWLKETTRRLGVMVPSRLDRRSHRTAPPAKPCPATFPGEPGTTCEGREGHEGDCCARVTVTWPNPRERCDGKA